MATDYQITLDGVPETMLWPLWNRGAEQRQDNRLLDDPLAAELIARIDYDFRGTFGAPNLMHSIRARLGDELIADYADACTGDPIVIALGDGLETQLWRVSDPRIRWFSVDLPESIAVRERVLPSHPRARLIPSSALDPAWLDDVPKGASPFVSATGLLMYFNEADVVRLLATIADHFPNATIYFDTIPPYFSRKTMNGFKVTRRYTAPQMPWGISVDDIPAFLDAIPGLRTGQVMTYADPYPERTRFYHLLSKIGPIRRRLAGGLVIARATKKTAIGYRG